VTESEHNPLVAIAELIESEYSKGDTMHNGLWGWCMCCLRRV
jgi:hypothetical protein